MHSIVLVSIGCRADAGGVTLAPQSSTTLHGAWQDVAGAAFISNQRLSGVPAMERLTFRIPSPPGSPSFFVRFAIR